MNREMRRLQDREERRQKKQDAQGGKVSRKAAAMQSRPVAEERKPLFRRLGGYLHEVRMELRKVTWPTQEQMIAFTTVTVITSVVLTGVIFGFDIVVKKAVFWLLDQA